MRVWVLRGSGADPDHRIAWGEGAGLDPWGGVGEELRFPEPSASPVPLSCQHPPATVQGHPARPGVFPPFRKVRGVQETAPKRQAGIQQC